MTTIVYRDGVLAADSQATVGNLIVPGGTQKLHRLRDGSVASMAGIASAGRGFIAWLDRGAKGDRPTLEGTVVVHLTADGCIEYDEFGTNPVDEFQAWGSGQQVATGALYAGCTAEAAVQIACLADTGTSEPVYTAGYEAPKAPKARKSEKAKSPKKGKK